MSDPIALSDVPALRAQGDLARMIKHYTQQGQRAAAQRRALVLRHPDLADKLTKAPINHSTPDKWNGYIPPATDGAGAPNKAPCRPALLALVAEAERREQASTTRRGTA